MITVGGRDLTRNPMFLIFPDDDDHVDGRHVHGRCRTLGKAAAELNEERKDYFSYLANLRDDADATGDEQRDCSGMEPPRSARPGRRCGHPQHVGAPTERRGLLSRARRRRNTPAGHPADGTRNRPARGPRTGVDGGAAPVRQDTFGGARPAHCGVAAGIPDRHLRGRAQAVAAAGPLDGPGAVHISRTRPRAGRSCDRESRWRNMELGQVATARPTRR